MDSVSSISKSRQKNFFALSNPNSSTGANLQIISRFRKFLKKSTCIRNILLERQQQGSRHTRIGRYRLILVALPFRHSLLVIWRIKAKTLIEKNNKSSRYKNFRRFRGFALHFESAGSLESWENFVTLADKRLDYVLTGLKLISNLQNQQKTGSGQLFTWQITTDFTWYKNW